MIHLVPLIVTNSYQTPLLLRNGHVATIYAALYRKAPALDYTRKTLETEDGDFVDMDLSQVEGPGNESGKVAILLHGLEGSTQAHYVRSMTGILNQNGWDTVGMNFRGCGGRPNLKERSYHSGDTGDLQAVVKWVEDYFPKSRIALIGFSLGGNVLLKYLGEGSRRESVVAGVAVSVPCDLTGSAHALAHPFNRVYMRKFMRDLTSKLEEKNARLGTCFDISTIRKMKTFAEFDGSYTAPVHGFASAKEYWETSSSLQFLQGIKVPTLLINALDDPFLSPSCYPTDLAEQHSRFHLETPKHGGHVGFLDSVWKHDHCWHEDRVVAFLKEKVFL